jgi:hypothetical protein
LRIILHRLYGVRTSTVYDVDGVAERLGKDLIGFTDCPGTLAELRASDEPHFIKTHRQRDVDVDENDPAICLVRDGRDALVSWARQASEEDPGSYEAELRERILRVGAVGTGSWGNNILSWLQPPAPHRIVLRYEDLSPGADCERIHRLCGQVSYNGQRRPWGPYSGNAGRRRCGEALACACRARCSARSRTAVPVSAAERCRVASAPPSAAPIAAVRTLVPPRRRAPSPRGRCFAG